MSWVIWLIVLLAGSALVWALMRRTGSAEKRWQAEQTELLHAYLLDQRTRRAAAAEAPASPPAASTTATPGPGTSSRVRVGVKIKAAMCLWCGKAVAHPAAGDDPATLEAIAVMRAHDFVCEKNPLKLELDDLRAENHDLRRALDVEEIDAEEEHSEKKTGVVNARKS